MVTTHLVTEISVTRLESCGLVTGAPASPCYVCAFIPGCFFFFFPHLVMPPHLVLLHAGRALFLSVLIPYPTMHRASPPFGLPCPVAVCPRSVPLSLPSLCCCILLISTLPLRSRSTRGGGERRRGRQECLILFAHFSPVSSALFTSVQQSGVPR